MSPESTEARTPDGSRATRYLNGAGTSSAAARTPVWLSEPCSSSSWQSAASHRSCHLPRHEAVSETVALGHVAVRTVESILILVGVMNLMSVVGLRQDPTAVADSGAVVELPVDCSPCAIKPSFLGPQFAWELLLSVWFLARGSGPRRSSAAHQPFPTAGGPPDGHGNAEGWQPCSASSPSVCGGAVTVR